MRNKWRAVASRLRRTGNDSRWIEGTRTPAAMDPLTGAGAIWRPVLRPKAVDVAPFLVVPHAITLEIF